MSENKKKYAYWMKPSMVEEITEMLDTANATSKSDFVCQAVQFYIGYLHQKKCIEDFSALRNFPKHLIKLPFCPSIH